MYPPTSGAVPGMTPMTTSAPPNPGGPGSYDAPAAITDPQQLIQQTAILAKSQGYNVEPDGRIYKIVDGKKDYFPPWSVWTGPNATPASDPSSPWHFMYQASGPFTNTQQWDASKGTYEGGINWPTLLTAIGVGGMVAAGVAAGASGGTGALTTGAGTTADFSSEAPEIAGALTPGIGEGGTLVGLAAGGTGATTLPAATSGLDAGVWGEGVGAEIPGSTAGITGAGGPVGAAAPWYSSAFGGATGSVAPVAQTGGFLSNLFAPGGIGGTLIGAGTGILGAALQAHAAGEASADTLKGIEEAIALQRELYNKRAAILAPYQQLGTQSLSGLARFMGIDQNASPSGSGGIPMTSGTQPVPGAPPMRLTTPLTLQAPSSSTGMVTMKAPTGTVSQVPRDQVSHYQSLGAVLV